MLAASDPPLARGDVGVPPASRDPSPGAMGGRRDRPVGLYLEVHSPAVAATRVVHIDALCAHPAFTASPRGRCARQGLRSHRRRLACKGHAGRRG
jgi:hypothetical protein